MGGGGPEFFHERFRIAQVLDDIEQKDLIELRDIDGKLAGIEVELPDLNFGIGRWADVLIDSDDPCSARRHGFSDIALAAADIEDARPRLDGIERHGV